MPSRKDLDRVAAVFGSAFTPNPYRHGIMRGYDARSRKKLSTTVSEPVNRKMVVEHLQRLDNLGRLGYLPGREKRTDVVCIDIDQKEQGAGFDQALSETLMAARMMSLTYYLEISTNGGVHIWLFLNDWLDWSEAHWFARAITMEAGHPYLEVFPSSADSGAKGKWIYMPYSGAMSEDEGGRGLGMTWLVTRDHDPVPVWSLEHLVRNDTPSAREYGQRARLESEKVVKEARKSGDFGQDLDVEAFDELRRVALLPPQDFRRHDSLAAFLNLSARAAQLERMVDLMRSYEIFEKWITDGSRTYQAWQEEVDRWVSRIRVDEGQLRSRYGLKVLLEQGFQVKTLKKRPHFDIEDVKDINKVPDLDLARKLWDLMRQEGHHWWYDPDVATGYRWDGTTYVAEPHWEDSIKRWIDLRLESYEKYIREGKLSSVYAKLERSLITRHLNREVSSDRIACENGVLDWREGTLQPAHPDVVTVGRVAAAWDPRKDVEQDWKGTAWHGFVLDVLKDQEPLMVNAQVETMAEFFGYCLLPLNASSPVKGVRKILNFHGPSSTGKTTTWRTVLSVLGDQSEDFDSAALAMSTDPELFASQDWAQKLVGKRLAVFDEMHTATGNEGRRIVNNLKILAGNGAVTINPKGLKSTQARLGCRVMMCTNYDLRLYEDSSNDAFFRRLLRIPFNNVVTRDQERSDYERDLTEDPIARGDILMWMIDGLRRLANNGWAFRHDTLLSTHLEEARIEANPVIGFLQQRCRPARRGESVAPFTAADISHQYSMWAAENGFKPLVNQAFGRSLRDALTYLGWASTVRRRVLKGYGLWEDLVVKDAHGRELNDDLGVASIKNGALVRHGIIEDVN